MDAFRLTMFALVLVMLIQLAFSKLPEWQKLPECPKHEAESDFPVDVCGPGVNITCICDDKGVVPYLNSLPGKWHDGQCAEKDVDEAIDFFRTFCDEYGGWKYFDVDKVLPIKHSKPSRESAQGISVGHPPANATVMPYSMGNSSVTIAPSAGRTSQGGAWVVATHTVVRQGPTVTVTANADQNNTASPGPIWTSESLVMYGLIIVGGMLWCTLMA